MASTDWLGAGARVGDYVIDRELGAKPGFVAFSARHSLLPRRARISTVHAAFAGSQAISMQLPREACVLEVLRHAGVPRVFECAELPDGRPWVASELVEGPSLSVILAEEGRLGVPMVLALLAGVAEILHYAHTRGLVHRNLRPDAIASRPEGPCILDWSDARSRESQVLQLVPLDWLAYQPPEVIGGESADSFADVFALGVIAYEALTGAKPSATVRWGPTAPPRLTALLDRMVAHDPLVRPTAAEVRAEALAIVEQIEVPLAPLDEDGTDVQIVDLELHAEADAEQPSPMADGSLSWAAPEIDEHARTKTMPPPPAPPFDPARTKTEPMLPEHLVSVSRTETEPMTAELEPLLPEPRAPEPRLPRTSTRIATLALPSRVLDPSGTKTP